MVLLSTVEPQISHFANFIPCEELVPKRHFWKMCHLRMVNFDTFGGLTSVLKFHIFLIFNYEELCVFVSSAKFCEELVLNFHKCEESVPVLHSCEELVLSLHKCCFLTYRVMLSLSASLKHRVMGIYTAGWLVSFSYKEPSLRMSFKF